MKCINAHKFSKENIIIAYNIKEIKEIVDRHYAKVMWCGDEACESKVKKKRLQQQDVPSNDQLP